LRRRLRLYEIVDAGAPAADVRFGRRQQLDSGNRGEQLARLRANTLGMREVTRIVIDDARLDRMPRRARLAGFDQRFGDVAHLRAEGTRTIRPRGIIVKQLAVFLHRRSAAGRVDDDAIDAGALEHADVVLRELAR